MSFNIHERGFSYCLIRSPYPPKNFLNEDFKRSLKKLIGKSRRPQNKTSILGASPGIPYKLWDKDAIGGRRWNILNSGMENL